MPDHAFAKTAEVGDTEAVLRRARLHLRLGKRRLQNGRTAAGLAALYEAILCGMRYFTIEHRDCAPFVKSIDLWDSTGFFHALARAGVFDDPLTFNRLSLIVERALWQRTVSLDSASVLADAEQILHRLGVIPANESAGGESTSLDKRTGVLALPYSDRRENS